ncbi:hypothetical protein ACQPZ8_31970 [Actinomadura nitritigenes]|uniref:hypothetical protein n=1 Tax=Actinomadura nitritigenes TaxID=134602 RepID=UPI003D925202
MGGTVFLLLGVAALAVYTGRHWERARRAASDMRLSRRRVAGLRRTAVRERGQATMIAAGAVVVLVIVVKYG